MTALPVKKNPTIAGRACTSSVRKILSVGVCRAPAIPVRKATIKNAVEVRSNDFALVTVGELCMLVDHWKRKTRSLRCLSENKQGAKSKSASKIKIAFQSEKAVC